MQSYSLHIRYSDITSAVSLTLAVMRSPICFMPFLLQRVGFIILSKCLYIEQLYRYIDRSVAVNTETFMHISTITR